MSVSAILPRPPLPEDKARLLAGLTDGLDAGALWWLSGYAAGLAQRQGSSSAQNDAPIGEHPSVESNAAARLTIVYGSQTGNAKRVAEQLAHQAEATGLHVRLARADAYPLRELKQEHLLYAVISTQGDGDSPDDARGFVEFVVGKRAPELKQLKYAVLGLGDSSYPQFCAVARKLDARFAELGATRALERGEADLDIEAVAKPWSKHALETAKESLKPHTPLASVTPLRPVLTAPTTSREHPFATPLLMNQRITARDSTKDIRHIELSLEDSVIRYEPGDALGVWPRNPPALVDALLETLHLNGDAAIARDGDELPLREWLTGKRELTRLSRPFLAALSARANDPDLNRLLGPENAEG
ncbi:MAG: flavodoxin domain-containing protein, partial [Rhodanobacteraceae bacterium]